MSYPFASLSAIRLAIRDIIQREFWWLVALALAVGFTMLMVYFPPLSMLVSWSQWSPIAACLSTLSFRLGWSSYKHLKALDRTTLASEDRGLVAKQRRKHLWTLYFNALMITAAVIGILVLASPATIIPALAAVFNIHLGISWAWQMAIMMMSAQTLAFFTYSTLYQWSEKSKHEIATHTFYKSAAAAIFTLGLLMGLAFIIVITGICPPLSMLVQDIILYMQCNFPQAMVMVAVLLLAIVPLAWGSLRAGWAWLVNAIQTWSDNEITKRMVKQARKDHIKNNAGYKHLPPDQALKPTQNPYAHGIMGSAKWMADQCPFAPPNGMMPLQGHFSPPPRQLSYFKLHESPIGIIDLSACCIHVTVWLQGHCLKVPELARSAHAGLRAWAAGMDTQPFGGEMKAIQALSQQLQSLAPTDAWGLHMHVFFMDDRRLESVVSPIDGGVQLTHQSTLMKSLKDSSPSIPDATLLLERLYNHVKAETIRLFGMVQARLGDGRMLDSVGRSWTLLMCIMIMVQRLRRSGDLTASMHLLLQVKDMLVELERRIVAFDAQDVIVIENALVVNGAHLPVARDLYKRKDDVDKLLQTDGCLPRMLVYTDLFVAYHLSQRLIAYFDHVMPDGPPAYDAGRADALSWHDPLFDPDAYAIWCGLHRVALAEHGPSQDVMRLLIISQGVLQHEHRKKADATKPKPPYLCHSFHERMDAPSPHVGWHVLGLFCPFDGDESFLSLALTYAHCLETIIYGGEIELRPHVSGGGFFQGASQVNVVPTTVICSS